jgi:predicted ATPase
MTQDNARAVIGDNRAAPDTAARVHEMLERDYAELGRSVTALLDEARKAPTEVENEETALQIGALIKRLKDTDTRVENLRQSEKEPHLRAGNAVDQFFHSLRDKLARRARQNKPGAVDILQARVNDFLERKRAAEEAERRRIAEEEARKARQAREAWEAQQKAAMEAALAAERARTEKSVAAKSVLAEHAKRQAEEAQAEAILAAERAQEAHVHALAKPADMARTRGDDGVLLTQASEGYVILLDRSLLDWEQLAPFFAESEIEKALRGWAKTTGYTRRMDGAEIGFRRKGVVR